MPYRPAALRQQASLEGCVRMQTLSPPATAYTPGVSLLLLRGRRVTAGMAATQNSRFTRAPD